MKNTINVVKNQPIINSYEDCLIRLPKVLTLFPVSKSAWYAGIKAGIYPAPEKIGARTSAWKLSKIQQLISGGCLHV